MVAEYDSYFEVSPGREIIQNGSSLRLSHTVLFPTQTLASVVASLIVSYVYNANSLMPLGGTVHTIY